ncbi:UNVERIFIED_CONTAM: hypothetical protein FKN15_024018 [Acipenser sinensis]
MSPPKEVSVHLANTPSLVRLLNVNVNNSWTRSFCTWETNYTRVSTAQQVQKKWELSLKLDEGIHAVTVSRSGSTYTVELDEKRLDVTSEWNLASALLPVTINGTQRTMQVKENKTQTNEHKKAPTA